MNIDAYIAVITLLMGDAPSQLDAVRRDALVDWANDHAVSIGYNSWIDAYHAI